jgi:hypothetical protein
MQDSFSSEIKACKRCGELRYKWALNKNGLCGSCELDTMLKENPDMANQIIRAHRRAEELDKLRSKDVKIITTTQPR